MKQPSDPPPAGEPARDVPPAGDPYAELRPYPYSPYGYGGYPPYPPPRRRPWYRAPGSLIGAATFTGVCAWITAFAMLVTRLVVETMDDADAIEKFFFAFVALLVLGVAIPVAMIAGALLVGGVIATVPLAVGWFRDPRRSAGPGLALIHAVVAVAAVACVPVVPL